MTAMPSDAMRVTAAMTFSASAAASELVGSSRMTSFGFPRRTRAISSSWRSAGLRLATSVFGARHARNKAQLLVDDAHALVESILGAAGAAVAQFLAMNLDGAAVWNFRAGQHPDQR